MVAAASGPGLALLLEEAAAPRGLRQFLAAIAAYRKAIDMAPARAEIYVELAETYEALGEFACAVPAYEQVIRLRPERASTYRSVVQCVLKLAETVVPTSKKARDLRKLAGMFWLALGRLRRRVHRCSGSFNGPQKLSPSAIPSWSAIFSAVPDSRRLLISIG